MPDLLLVIGLSSAVEVSLESETIVEEAASTELSCQDQHAQCRI